jgi:hypothetical protein
MVQRVSTVAFEGIEARAVDVQVQVAPGLPAFAIVRTNNSSFRRVIFCPYGFSSFETVQAPKCE